MRIKFQFLVPPALSNSGYYYQMKDNYEFDLPCIPHVREKVFVADFLNSQDFNLLFRELNRIWSGNTAIVNEVILRKEVDMLYYEIVLMCVDEVADMNKFFTYKERATSKTIFG